jgi:hypothetical protein
LLGDKKDKNISTLTVFQSGGRDYAHCITACPPRFEKLTASLHSILAKPLRSNCAIKRGQ